MGDCHDEGWEEVFRENVIRGVVDKLVEVVSVGFGTDGKCECPGWVIREVVDLCLLLEFRACLLVLCEVCGAEEEVVTTVAAAEPSN